MNTYLIPVYDGFNIFIDKITAVSLEEAQLKYIDKHICDEDPYPDSWDEFVKQREEMHGTIVGDLYEISEF